VHQFIISISVQFDDKDGVPLKLRPHDSL